MKTKKLIALLLATVTVLCTIPFTAFAADPAVQTIDGERAVFVSSFGKTTYSGKSYVSFKKFEDALAALGTEGGTIILTGTAALGNFKDLDGRKPIKIRGLGTKASGNRIDFTGPEGSPVSEVNLKGDIILDFVNLRMDKDAFLFTNGYALTTANEFDTYHELTHNSKTGITTTSYPNPPSIAIGELSGGNAAAMIETGTFNNIVAGSAAGKKVDGNTYIKVDGGNIANVISGNLGNGTTNGNPTLVVSGATITKLVAGSAGGTVNGNIVTEINNGTISEMVIGAESGATVNGNIVVSINGGEISGTVKAGAGTVNGKKIVILSDTAKADIASGAADYVITTTNAFCEPQYDGTTLKGFLISDIYGIPATTAVINGSNVSSADGVYSLANGKSTVSVKSDVKIAINKNAHYVAGYADGTFLPQNNMTRAEAITLLTRLITDESVIKGKVTATYSDVEPGSWYESYIGLFEKLGFLENIEVSYGANILPNATITRGEFAELVFSLSKFVESSASTKLKSFPDVGSGHPYAGAINFAVANNIVNGYEDGTFRPENNITRAEVVTIVNRFLGRNPNGAEGGINFSDIANHWAKTQILAAAGDENVTWTAAPTTGAEYVLTGNKAEDYIKALHQQSATLSGDAIRRGVDTVANKMKQDILNSPNTAEIHGDKMTGTIYYISEKNGNDENDGKSPETAWKTFAGMNNMRFPGKGTTILLERGGLYRGTLTVGAGFVYGAYGEGPKPVVTQSKKNYADPTLWVETQWPNVWLCTDKLVNVGVVAFDHDIHNYTESCYDETYGLIMNKNLHGFDGPEELCGDLQFYSVITNSSTRTADNFYLYCEGGNPGKRFKSIEIGENIAILNGASNDVTIDNISFKFTGGHGMGGAGGCKNRLVTNCIWSWIGGSVLTEDFHGTGRTINYGNAVEVYGECNGFTVENNWMYQIYDTAVTHQRSTSTGDCIQENINYLSNLMEYVYWGIEFYNKAPTAEQLNGRKDTYKRITRNVHTAYNVLRKGGYGWGSIVRYRGCELYSGAQLGENYDCLTEYNIFDRAYKGVLLYLPSNSKEVENCNIYIQHIGQDIGNLKGTKVRCDYSLADNLATHWGDKNAVAVVIDPEKDPIVINTPKGLGPIDLNAK